MASEMSGSHVCGFSFTDTIRNAFTRWLSLAAAPAFAIMAVLTWRHTTGMQEMAAPGINASPLTSMAAMYLLMAGFHLVPWLRCPAPRRPKHHEPARRSDAEVR